MAHLISKSLRCTASYDTIVGEKFASITDERLHMSSAEFSESFSVFPWYVLANEESDDSDDGGMGTVGDDSVFVTEEVDGESCLILFTKEPLATKYVESKAPQAEVVAVDSFGEATVILENAGVSFVSVNMDDQSNTTRFLIDELLDQIRGR